MKGTTIFMAGAEVETLTNALLDNGVKFILYSYYYILTMRRTEYILRMQDEHPDVWWLLDSGAFTYSVQATSGKDLPTPEKYVQGYFKFIDRYGERWWRVTEPDLDGIQGMNVTGHDVALWREEMLSRWPHLPIMPCYHAWRGEREWDEYCADPRIKYLALGRGCGGKNDWRRLTMKAQKYAKPVHGFGYTRVNSDLAHGVDVDSVDSTSWVMGQKYGSTYVLKGDRLITLTSDEKSKRRAYKGYFEGIGVNFQKILDDDVAELRKANIITWRNLATRFHLLKDRRDRLTGMNEHEVLDEHGIPVGSAPGRVLPNPRVPGVMTVNPDVPRPQARQEGTVLASDGRPLRRRVLGAFGVPVADPTVGNPGVKRPRNRRE